MENNGLDVLRLVVKNYDDVRITRLVCAILGNLAVDVCSRDDMIRKGSLECHCKYLLISFIIH